MPCTPSWGSLPRFCFKTPTRRATGNPVALTAKHDPVGGFRFTLCHELAHVWLHFDLDESRELLDALDTPGGNRKREVEASAAEAVIPLFPKSL